MIQVAEVTFQQIPENEEYEKLAEQVLQKCFELEKVNPEKFYVGITLTNPENIHKLNKQYRKVDKPTDVLSFPMFEPEELIQKLKEPTKQELIPKTQTTSIQQSYGQDVLGDIVISIPKVKEQAIEYGHSFKREYAYMLVHGFYHLMGYDHMEEEEKKVMRQKEEKVLEKLELIR